jgi:hypothetical protein
MAHPTRGRSADRERIALRAFLLLAVVPNLVLRAAEYAIRGNALVVNVEFLMIALVAPFLGVQLTVAALVVAAIADATTFIAPVFHFEMDAVIPSLAQLATARPLVFSMLALLTVTLIWAASRLLVRAVSLEALRDGRVRGTLLAAVVLLIAADAANGSGNAISTRRAFLPVNVAGAPTLQLVIATIRPFREARLPARPIVPVGSATASLFADLTGAPAPRVRATNIAVVLVESMGQLLDARADSALFAALLDSQVVARYEVRRGKVRFDGPTTGGEFRELCGELRTYRTAPTVPLQSCLPVRLHQLGYTTIALHGFRRGMFGRERWYPLIGIDSIIDDATIESSGDVPKCGTIFRGPCDAAVATVFSRLLATSPGEHRLVYWLTLSAHFPADARAAEGSTFDCAISPVLRSDDSACMLARIWSRDLAAIRTTAIGRELPPTRFIIVGDHAPPLPGDRLARLFSTDVVPFVELIPRVVRPRDVVDSRSIGVTP